MGSQNMIDKILKIQIMKELLYALKESNNFKTQRLNGINMQHLMYGDSLLHVQLLYFTNMSWAGVILII